MNRPGLVRLVALLMLLVGLQAGSFRDLTTTDERYYGSPDQTTAVRPEARKPDVVPLPEPTVQPPRVAQWASDVVFPAPAPRVFTLGRAFHFPGPTGPPRA